MQQQQGYRLPTAGQGNFPPNQQPIIRPQGPQVNNGGVRQVINPNQPPLIRNNIPQTPNNPSVRLPITQQQQPQQFRPPPPQQQQQQQFQRPQFQVPLDQQQQQFRPQQPPINLQRQPVPEQKFIRNPLPPQNQNMMAEINRERTFTTSHEGSMDDDDDVVIGRMVTPQARPNLTPQKPVESYDQRSNIQQQQQQPPMPQQRPVQQSQQPMQQPMMQRRESVQSIPSRPPSGMGSNNSQSPEPRTSPMPPQNVMPSNIQQNRVENNRNVPNEMNRQSPSNYEYARDPMDFNDRAERVQRPINQTNNNVPTQQQRRTSIYASEEPMQRQNPAKVIQQPVPPQPQFRPAPVQQQMPQSEIYTVPIQEPKKSQPEHFTQQQQPQRQQNLQDNKTNPSALKQQDQKRSAVEAKPVDIQSSVQNMKNAVRLDLGKSENIRSAKDKSPSKKKKTSFVHISS